MHLSIWGFLGFLRLAAARLSGLIEAFDIASAFGPTSRLDAEPERWKSAW
jgi:hypothetical protein